ncbi:MAG TPA: DUF1580 domain-containing protein [Gemmataceae bacterium]|nr:DUF1580 domain-containing protein [Gemmataceae bacterium]
MTDVAESPLVHEPWISLSQAAKLFPPARRGRPVSGSCVWRWFKQGVRTADGRRVHLETLRVVNRYVTSEPAVRRFIMAQQPVSAAGVSAVPTHPAPRTPGQRARADAKAAAKLQALGL